MTNNNAKLMKVSQDCTDYLNKIMIDIENELDKFNRTYDMLANKPGNKYEFRLKCGVVMKLVLDNMRHIYMKDQFPKFFNHLVVSESKDKMISNMTKYQDIMHRNNCLFLRV